MSNNNNPTQNDSEWNLLVKILNALNNGGGGSGAISGAQNVGSAGIGLFKGNNSGTLEFKRLASGTGITLTDAPDGHITIDSGGGGGGDLIWETVTVDTAIQEGHGYVANSGSVINFQLPATFTANARFAVAGFGSGGWKISQASGQTMHVDGTSSATGSANGFQSTDQNDALTFICSAQDTDFTAIAVVGSPTNFSTPGPFYVASSIGGKPGVKIKGGESLTIPNNPGLFGVNVSIFVVWKITNSSGSTWMIEKCVNPGETGTWLYGAHLGPNNINFFSSATGVQCDSDFTPSDGVGFQGSLIYDGTSAKMRHNGTADATSPDDSGPLIDNGGAIHFGNMASYGGDDTFLYEISEFLYYTNAVNDTDRDNIEGYLLDKYGLGAGVPFDPTTVSGLKVWLKADTLVLNDGDPVTEWDDSSGSGNNAYLNPPVISTPTFRTNQVNGLPTVSFDGVDDILNIADSVSFFGVKLSIFLVCQYYDVPSQNWCFVKGFVNADPNSFFGFLYGAGNNSGFIQFAANFADGPAQGTSDFAVPNTGFQQSNIRCDGSTLLFRGNQTDSAFAFDYGDAMGDLQQTTGPINLGGFEVPDAGSLRTRVDISEILLYNVEISDTDRDNVEGYLADKYALGVGAPFDPTTISGLKIWLKADSISQLDGSPVTLWVDSSGNGNDATNP